MEECSKIVVNASRNPSKQISSSRKRHCKSAERSELHTHSEAEFQKKGKGKPWSSYEIIQSNPLKTSQPKSIKPIEEKVLKKLKKERKFLKKWTEELNQARHEIMNSTNAGDLSSEESKISDIEKRYNMLLPAIKLAMETMEKATSSKSCLKDASGVDRSQQQDSPSREIPGPLSDEKNTLELEGRKRSMKESDEHSLECSKGSYKCESVYNSTKNSQDSLLTELSKLQLAKEERQRNVVSKKVQNIMEAADDANDVAVLLTKEERQRNTVSKKLQEMMEAADANDVEVQLAKTNGAVKQTNRHARETSIKNPELDAAGVIGETKVSDSVRKTVNMKNRTLIRNMTKGKILKDHRTGKIRKRVMDDKIMRWLAAFPSRIKWDSRRNYRMVEQNVLCTGPNMKPASITPSSSVNEPDPSKVSVAVSDLKMPAESGLSSAPSSCEENMFVWRESVGVQTSFSSSSDGPCKPETCPNRTRRVVDNRAIEVQTDDTDIEWQYGPTKATFKTKTVSNTRYVVSKFKIPPKRTQTMEDRLQRRIMYFDSHPSSVCNKNVQFCTYNVRQTKKKPKGQEKQCPDCPGSRKCHLVLGQHPFHPTCNEVVIEVISLKLNQEGVDSLKKVCSFLYVDYVFLGHVGNETNLAPVSDNVLFDSGKSFCVSLRYNKKQRSILREQFNPSGLLVKDSIMFILVCQAAPEFDLYKNWDFGFGYLSMKHIRDQMGNKKKLYVNVEMQKIGGKKSNIGTLMVSVDGLETIRSITNEELRCVEPQPDAVIKKLNLNKKELIAVANNQTTCVRRVKNN